jgi:hypothetical protein
MGKRASVKQIAEEPTKKEQLPSLKNEYNMAYVNHMNRMDFIDNLFGKSGESNMLDIMRFDADKRQLFLDNIAHDMSCFVLFCLLKRTCTNSKIISFVMLEQQKYNLSVEEVSLLTINTIRAMEKIKEDIPFPPPEYHISEGLKGMDELEEITTMFRLGEGEDKVTETEHTVGDKCFSCEHKDECEKFDDWMHKKERTTEEVAEYMRKAGIGNKKESNNKADPMYQ